MNHDKFSKKIETKTYTYNQKGADEICRPHEEEVGLRKFDTQMT